MKAEIQIHSCGSGAAHSPHASRILAGWWCPGVIPVWPCERGRRHVPHIANTGDFYCPGTTKPPTDIVAPQYSIVDVCSAIEAAQQASMTFEEAF